MTQFNADVALDLTEHVCYNLTLDEIRKVPGVYQHKDSGNDYIVVFPSYNSPYNCPAIYVNEDTDSLGSVLYNSWSNIKFRKCNHINVHVVLKRVFHESSSIIY